MDFSVPYVQTTLMNDDIDIVFGKYSTPSYPYWSDCPVILSMACWRIIHITRIVKDDFPIGLLLKLAIFANIIQSKEFPPVY
jgi:hypothetical protein